MGAPDRPPVTLKPVVLQTGPDPKGFLSRYLLALTPLVLFGVSIIMTGLMRGFLGGTFAPILSGPAKSLLPGVGDLMEMAVLLTAPVCLYVTFVIIGWRVRSTEMWAGSALALGFASLAGFILFTMSPDRSVSPALDLLYWIAYLTGPVSLIVVILILGFTEQFRRSIRYTIEREGLILRGGIWKQREHMLPWYQIRGLVLERNLLEKLFGTGTIIPVGAGNPGQAVQGARGPAAGKEISRSPLDCLYGVREPELVMEFLQELTSRPADENL